MLRTRVLVVGAGPAGATAARILASRGIDTVVVDRDLSYRKPCGGGISSLALDEFRIPSHAVMRNIRRIRVTPPRGDSLTIDLKGGHLCIIERGRFDTTLRELASAEGAAVLEGSFLRCGHDDGCMLSEVQTENEGAPLLIRSDYLIAADGVSGRVARSLGIAKPRLLFTVSARVPARLACAASASGDDDACEFWFGSPHASRFYSWVFPSAESSSIGTGSPAANDLTRLLDAFTRRRFGSPLAALDADGLISRRRVFSIPSWSADTVFSRGNALFVGDAAAMVLPVTHEGIYYAMKSGQFAAEAIAEGRPPLYRTLWSERFRRRFSLMKTISGIFYGGDEITEKWVALHRSPEVQELSMRLWLRQERSTGLLTHYLKIFRHLLRR